MRKSWKHKKNTAKNIANICLQCQNLITLNTLKPMRGYNIYCNH